MKRKVAILILSVMHLALSVAAQAQQQAKIHKIGFLGTRPASGTTGISGGVAGVSVNSHTPRPRLC